MEWRGAAGEESEERSVETRTFMSLSKNGFGAPTTRHQHMIYHVATRPGSTDEARTSARSRSTPIDPRRRFRSPRSLSNAFRRPVSVRLSSHRRRRHALGRLRRGFRPRDGFGGDAFRKPAR